MAHFKYKFEKRKVVSVVPFLQERGLLYDRDFQYMLMNAQNFEDSLKNLQFNSFLCPYCKKTLLRKIIFPIGGEYPIETVLGPRRMKRVFYCPICRNVYSIVHEFITDGEIFTLNISNDSDFIAYVRDMDRHGTTVGRPD